MNMKNGITGEMIICLHHQWLVSSRREGKQMVYENISIADLLGRYEQHGVDLTAIETIDCDYSNMSWEKSKLDWAILDGSDFASSYMAKVDFSNSSLKNASFKGASLQYANLKRADCRGVDFSHCNLTGVNFENTRLKGAIFVGANLTGAQLPPNHEMIFQHYEMNDQGVIAYKSFDELYAKNPNWDIKEGAVLTETVNYDRCELYGCGISVGGLAYILKYNKPHSKIWRCLIRKEWLPGMLAPYGGEGKARCEKIELLEIIGTTEELRLRNLDFYNKLDLDKEQK